MDQIATLRERVEILEEENRQLRALQSPPDAPYMGLGLSKTERIVTAVLVKAKGLCSRDHLLDCISVSQSNAPEPKTIDVVLCRIRKKLAVRGFQNAIMNEWGEGWKINPLVRDQLRAFFDKK